MDAKRLLGTVAAATRLRQDILGGTLAPGTRLITQKLASELALSRTPVREALASLEREGLVVREGNWGYAVRTIEARDASDLFEARLVIETATAFHAATRASEARIAAMEVALSRAADLLLDHRIAAFQQVSRSIHEVIAEASGNQLLIRMFRQVNDLVMLLAHRSLQTSPGRASGILEENRAIVAAIRARDPALASKRTRRHIEAGHAAFRRSLPDGGLAPNATVGDPSPDATTGGAAPKATARSGPA